MKYFEAIKMNELFLHILTWMNLINVMLSKRGQTKQCIEYDSIHIQFKINHNQCIALEVRIMATSEGL